MMENFPSRHELQKLTELLPWIEKLPVEEIPAALACLSSLQSALAARLLAVPLIGSQSAQNPKPAEEPDRLLTLEEAAQILRVDPDWIYKHKKLPFRVKLSPKTLRFSENGLRRYMARKKQSS